MFLFSSYPQRRRLPFLPPPKKKHSQSLCVCLSLSLTACCCRVFKGWALSLCLFLLRLSLLVTPPCVPTPHLSVSQELRSPAEEPSCRRPTGCRQAGRQAGRARRRGAAAEPRTKCVGIFLKNRMQTTRIHIHPLHPTPPHPPLIFECHAAAAGGSLIAQSSTHVTLMTSASGLIEDTSAGWGGCGRFTVFCVKALQHYV